MTKRLATYVKLVNQFKQKGISMLSHFNEEQLHDFLREANKQYYNKTPFLTDNEYDIIKEYFENKYPTSTLLTEIGTLPEKHKVKLPYFMGSMNKIKPDTNALSNWSAKYKGPYILSCKLDGVSGLYTNHKGVSKLYTRGDGTTGQDISYLIPFLKLPKDENVVLRGEFILSKSIFQEKYKTQFSNIRNMVAGIINHKKIHPAIKDIEFIAYEIVYPELLPSQQFDILKRLNVSYVENKMVSHLTNQLLSETLVSWRENYLFEIDGVIVVNNEIYERKHGNPDHAFAFKMVLTEQIAEAKVVNVLWSPSKDGYLKPRVQIEPILLGGVKIEYATGFNAAFIYENKIGVGALIQIIRSGDVIPHIQNVICSATEPLMPLVPYQWTNTHIDIVLENIEEDETVREKNITGFFRGIGVDGLSAGNIKRIMDKGYDSIQKILQMKFEDFLKVDGFQEKMALKILNGIESKMQNVNLITLMISSNLFGRGFSEKKIEMIMNECPDILNSNISEKEKIQMLLNIKGFAIKTASSFVERIELFIHFIKEIGYSHLLFTNSLSNNKIQQDTSHPLFQKTIVMSGFRENSIQEQIKQCGGKMGSNVSSKTFALIVKDKTERTSKINDALQNNIPLYTLEEFTRKYL